MAKMVAPDGKMTGVDVDTTKGRRSYTAGKDGLIEVNNASDAKALKAEGFIDASGASFAHVPGFPCSGCGFDSVFKAYDCPKCGVKNDYRD